MTAISRNSPSVLPRPLPPAVENKPQAAQVAPGAPEVQKGSGPKPLFQEDVFEARADKGSKPNTRFQEDVFETRREVGGPLAQVQSKAQVGQNNNQAVIDKIGGPRKEFEAATAKVEKADRELAQLVTGFGPAMTKEEQDKAIAAFKANHDEYTQVESAAAKLTQAINDSGTIQKELKNARPEQKKEFQHQLDLAKGQLDNLAKTEKGRDAIADAVEQKGEDKNPALLALADGRGAIQGAEVAVAKALGQRLASLAGEDQARADKLFNGLKKTAPLLGVKAEDLNKISDDLKAIHAGGGDAKLRDLDSHIKNLEVEPGGTKESARNGFKALGVIATTVTLAHGGSFDKKKLDEKIKAAGQLVGLSADSASLVTGSLAANVANPSKFNALSGALGKAGGVGGIVSAVSDFISSADSFKEGEIFKGITSLASGVGGVLTGAAAILPIPVAGQILGGLLTVGGFFGGFIADAVKKTKEEKAAEKDANLFLKAAGIPAEAARELSDLRGDEHKNVGMAIVQVAQYAQIDPRAFLQSLVHNPAPKIHEFVDVASRIGKDPKDPSKLATHYPATDKWFVDSQGKPIPPEKRPNSRDVVNAKPQSIAALKAWLELEKLLPR